MAIQVNVSIDPQVEPYVDATLDQVEAAIVAMDQLWPHLEGAFGSLKGGWPHMTPELRQALLEKCPRLTRAMALRDKMKTLLDEIPELNIED